MKDDKDKRERQAGAPAKNPAKDQPSDQRKDTRQHRLKLALRENLKRRKSQARGRSDGTIAASDHDAVSPADEREKKPGQ